MAKHCLLPLQIQRDAATIMQPYFTSNGLVTKALEHAFQLEHIMDLTRLRCLGSLFSMLHQACRNVAQYNANHPDFPMQLEQLERYVQVGPATRGRAGRGVARGYGPDIAVNTCVMLLLGLIKRDPLSSFTRGIWFMPSSGPCPETVG